MLEVDCEGTTHPADPGDLALATGQVYPARSDDLDLRFARRGTAASMLQPKLDRPPRRDL